jgi:hypothetical protein
MLLLIRYAWILFILTGIAANAQQLITGKVIDSSKKPVAFAHVLIEQSNRGTVTNAQGEFQLYIQSTDHELLITSIGYKSARQLLDETKSRYIIELPEDLVLLGEVVITPKDYAQELVKSAIKNIDKNYPINAELISGFLRERFSKDSVGKEYFHVVESQLEVLKESYQNAHDKGQVRLKKSVNVTESEVYNQMKIYAGGHLAHRFDFVMKRDGFLDSARMKKYRYEIEDTLRYNGHELIKVHYVKNDSSEYGSVFVDLVQLAFVKIEQFQNTDRGNLLDFNKRVYLKVTTEYFQSNGLWRIGYVNYETKFINKTPFHLSSIFSTHDFLPFIGEIPYHERLHFSQYMLEATKTAVASDWDGINRTLAETGEKQVAISKKKKVFDFGRLEYGLEFYHTPYRVNAHNVSFQNSSIDFNTSISAKHGNTQGLKIIMAYRINDRWRVYYAALGNLVGARLRDSGLGISYRQPLGIHSRFSIEPHIGLHLVQYTVAAGATTLQKNFSANRVKLDSERIKIYSGTTSSNFTSGISMRYELAYRWSFNVGFTHVAEINSSNGVFLIEDENALTNQRVFVKDGQKGLSIISNSKVMSLNYYVSTGFMYRL